MKNITTYINEQLTNHLTPIGNVLTNILNFYCLPLGIVAILDEAGTGIILKSSKFTSYINTKNILNSDLYSTTLYNYILQHGLETIDIEPFNGNENEWFVHCYAKDLQGEKEKKSKK